MYGTALADRTASLLFWESSSQVFADSYSRDSNWFRDPVLIISLQCLMMAMINGFNGRGKGSGNPWPQLGYIVDQRYFSFVLSIGRHEMDGMH